LKARINRDVMAGRKIRPEHATFTFYVEPTKRGFGLQPSSVKELARLLQAAALGAEGMQLEARKAQATDPVGPPPN